MHAPADTPAFRTIVVPLDGSTLSESALPVAATFARASQGTVHIARVHVPIYAGVDIGLSLPDVDEEARRGERAQLADTARRVARAQGIVVESQLLEGSVGRALAEHVRTLHADLVVITTHGRTGLSRMWLGSTADWLLRFLPVPVLLLHPHEGEVASAPLGPVLATLDFSERSERILADAAHLAKLGNSRLTLLHVITPLGLGPAPYGAATTPAVYDERLTADALRAAKTHLDAVAERVRRDSAGLEVTTEVIASPHPAEAIVEGARDAGARVVAMTSRGRGASRLLVGSVADKVLRSFEGMLLVLGPAALRELESDYVEEEQESTAGWK